MIKIVVCEDQKMISDNICGKIKQQELGEICRIDTFQKGEDVLKAMECEHYDIYYLDIELEEGGMNGYKLAQKIREQSNSAILIFLSSHDEYACEAYEIDALRFLRKPIVEEKFNEAFRKAIELLSRGKQVFTYTVHYQERHILLSEIRYFESVGRKIILHTCTGETDIFYGSLKEMQKDFQEKYFVCCHTSYLINMEYVKEIGADQICLSNGEKLPISRKYKNQVREKFVKYLFMVNRRAI